MFFFYIPHTQRWSFTIGFSYGTMTGVLLACVAGIQKGRGRKYGHKIAREGERRSGTHAKTPIFTIPLTNYVCKIQHNCVQV